MMNTRSKFESDSSRVRVFLLKIQTDKQLKSKSSLGSYNSITLCLKLIGIGHIVFVDAVEGFPNFISASVALHVNHREAIPAGSPPSSQ